MNITGKLTISRRGNKGDSEIFITFSQIPAPKGAGLNAGCE